MTDPGGTVEEARHALRSLLDSNGGSHLRTVVRQPGSTCSVCATFVKDPTYQRCWRCEDDHRRYGSDLADLVVPLTYGVNGATSGRVMFGYKSDRPGETTTTVLLLLLTGYVHHVRCMGLAVGQAVGPVVTVPSMRRDRAGVHPLRHLSDDANLTSGALTLEPTPQGRALGRATGRGAFTVSDPWKVLGEHVVVLDDTWVSGGNAQSAALALRDAGANKVTVLVIARWIERGRGGPTVAALERAHLDGIEAYDPLNCPVTGGACP